MKTNIADFELTESEDARALKLHDTSMVIDGCQSSEFISGYFHTVKDSGVTAAIVTIAWKQNCHETMAIISQWRKKIQENSNVALFAETVDCITQAKRDKKVAYLFEFQNTLPLEGDVELLDVYSSLGVKIIQLTYNEKKRRRLWMRGAT